MGSNFKMADELNKMYLERLNRLIQTSNCKKCGDTGWKIQTDSYGNYKTNAVGMLLEMPCNCLIEEQNIKMLKRSGLIERVKENTFAKYVPKNDKQKEAKKKAIQFTKDFKDNWLVLTGMTGTGKTHLAVAAWNEIQKVNAEKGIVKGIRAEMIVYNDLIAKIALGKRFDEDESFFEVIERYKHVSILLIDDLFRDNVHKESVEWMFQILNYRYDNKLPTIITTNHNYIELEHINEPIHGRIFERTQNGMYWLHFEEEKNANHRLFPNDQMSIKNK